MDKDKGRSIARTLDAGSASAPALPSAQGKRQRSADEPAMDVQPSKRHAASRDTAPSSATAACSSNSLSATPTSNVSRWPNSPLRPNDIELLKRAMSDMKIETVDDVLHFIFHDEEARNGHFERLRQQKQGTFCEPMVRNLLVHPGPSTAQGEAKREPEAAAQRLLSPLGQMPPPAFARADESPIPAQAHEQQPAAVGGHASQTPPSAEGTEDSGGQGLLGRLRWSWHKKEGSSGS